MPGPVLGILPVLTPLTHSNPVSQIRVVTHLIDKETEGQRGEAISTEAGFKPDSLPPKPGLSLVSLDSPSPGKTVHPMSSSPSTQSLANPIPLSALFSAHLRLQPAAQNVPARERLEDRTACYHLPPRLSALQADLKSPQNGEVFKRP